MDMRRSGRSRRPAARFDNGGDEAALQQALLKSLVEKQRVTTTIPEAPVFHPTLEEFQDPLGYITKIQPQAHSAGIFRVVPPEGWQPDFNLNVEQKFTTKRQRLHHLQEGLAFPEGNEYSQQEYKQYADSFLARWLESHPSFSEAMASLTPGDAEAAAALIEEEYWRIVERVSAEEVDIDYANDVDTEKYGTAFAPGFGPWDLNGLFQQRHSVLNKLGFAVEGVTFPWLYYGALFATFCWHVEDHYLYSINYLHAGAPKTWYGVPGSGMRKFDEVMRRIAPRRFQEERDLLHQLITLHAPSLLAAQGVKVVHAVQRAGEFIVTLPKAYHSGFSHGWNCAEAVNFATLQWLPFGLEAVRAYSKGPGKRPAIFSHDKLVWELCQETISFALQHQDCSASPVHKVEILQDGSTIVSPSAPAESPPLEAPTPSKPLDHLPVPLPATSPLDSADETKALRQRSESHAEATVSGRSRKPHEQMTSQEMGQLLQQLEEVSAAELKQRGILRATGIVPAALPPEQPAAELPSCAACGAIPFLSLIRCCCRLEEVRCLEHAHIGCKCGWTSKQLCCRVSDGALRHVVLNLGALLKGEAVTPYVKLATATGAMLKAQLGSDAVCHISWSSAPGTASGPRRMGSHSSAQAKKARLRSAMQPFDPQRMPPVTLPAATSPGSTLPSAAAPSSAAAAIANLGLPAVSPAANSHGTTHMTGASKLPGGFPAAAGSTLHHSSGSVRGSLAASASDAAHEMDAAETLALLQNRPQAADVEETSPQSSGQEWQPARKPRPKSASKATSKSMPAARRPASAKPNSPKRSADVNDAGVGGAAAPATSAKRSRGSGPRCTACGAPGKALLLCMACDCHYHLRCVAPHARKKNEDPDAPWLCENCCFVQLGS